MHERPISPAQLRAGRALLGLSQSELAQLAGQPVEAITQAEADAETGTSLTAVAALQTALERQGVIFLAADGGEGPGVRLRRSGPPDEGLRPDQLTSDNDIWRSSQIATISLRQPLSEDVEACQFGLHEAGMLSMAYRVRWQLVGRSGQPLDSGCIREDFCAYSDAMAAVVEFLRLYPEVSRCPTESYWLARRSRDADLAVWIWIEAHETIETIGATGAWMYSSAAAEQSSTLERD